MAIDITKVTPDEVVTDRGATYPIVPDHLLPAAWHHTEQYANNGIEVDHGRLKARLRPMCGDLSRTMVWPQHIVGWLNAMPAAEQWPPRPGDGEAAAGQGGKPVAHHHSAGCWPSWAGRGMILAAKLQPSRDRSRARPEASAGLDGGSQSKGHPAAR